MKQVSAEEMGAVNVENEEMNSEDDAVVDFEYGDIV